MSRFDSGVIGSYILSMSQFINQVRNFFAILFYGCLQKDADCFNFRRVS